MATARRTRFVCLLTDHLWHARHALTLAVVSDGGDAADERIDSWLRAGLTAGASKPLSDIASARETLYEWMRWTGGAARAHLRVDGGGSPEHVVALMHAMPFPADVRLVARYECPDGAACACHHYETVRFADAIAPATYGAALAAIGEATDDGQQLLLRWTGTDHDAFLRGVRRYDHGDDATAIQYLLYCYERVRGHYAQ